MSSNNSSDGELPRPQGVKAATSVGNSSPGVRPPLPPHAKGSMSPPQPPSLPHDRSTSIGEESEVSALSTEDNVTSNGHGRGAAPAKVATKHKRKVSWGFAAENLAASAAAQSLQSDSVLFQPDLSASGSGSVGGGPPSPPGAGELPPVSLRPKPNLSPAQSLERATKGRARADTHITLSEVAASPLEDEAETAIIRALEQRSWEDQDEDAKFQRAMGAAHATVSAKDSMSLGILGNVPDAAFRIVEEEEEAAAAADAPPASGEPSNGSVHGRSPKPTQKVHGRSPKPTQKTPAGELRGAARFQDIAGQLKAMQGQGTSNARGLREGGYLMKAAAAFKSKQHMQQSMRSITGSAVVVSVADRDGDAEDESEEDVERPPGSSADEMVHNLSKAYGLPTSAKDTFDVEAQAPAPTSSAGSKWGKVRLAVNTTSQMRHASVEAHAAKEDGIGGGSELSDGGDGTFGNEEKSDGRTSPTGNGGKKGKRLCCYRWMKNWKEIVVEVCSALQFRTYFKVVIGYIIIPSMFISAILFYAAGNPIAGTDSNENNNASYSWWLLFAGARQICTFTLSKVTEIVVIDILTLRTRAFLKFLGPVITLLVIQARGWPYILTFWAVWDFALLQGKHRFAKHWLFYTRIRWFMDCNDERSSPDCNPAGDVVQSEIYFRVLIACIVLGVSVALKRGYLAMYQGKKSTENYGRQLEKLMAKMLLITEVAHLAAEMLDAYGDGSGRMYFGGPQPEIDYKRLRGLKHVEGDDSDDEDEDENDSKSKASQRTPPPSPPKSPLKSSPKSMKDGDQEVRESLRRFQAGPEATPSSRTNNNSKYSLSVDTPNSRPRLDHAQAHISLGETAKLKLIELVGEWEEPAIMHGSRVKNIKIQDVLQFRQAVLCLDQKFPFGFSFGPARTRESCIESAQNVYERLLLHTPDAGILPFDTLALVALDRDGEIDERKARKLIRLFRPDRDGYLTPLDFVKSCDKVYKDLRTLRAAIANNSQIDHAFEQIVNIGFYFVIIMIVLTICKLDPWTLFLSLSGFILSFAFMFGAAASKYFEGILLILVQHPFDIGDRVHISNVQQDTSPNGSSTWFVEAVTLFATTVRFATTNEVATYSNGSLASSRIINSNRSPKATVYIYNKFANDVPFEKVMVFKSVIEEFVKERPRQWIAMSGFRATRCEADLGFIEYVIVLQHVEKWQNIGPILNSKAEVSSYCLEVQKKLGMRYEAPPLPVNLGINRATKDGSLFEQDQIGEDQQVATSSEPDFSALASLFTKPEAKKTK